MKWPMVVVLMFLVSLSPLGEASGVDLGDVVINEVLSHTDYDLVDAIELYNPGNAEIPIGGWWLSDSSDDFLKFQIPAGITIPAAGYFTVYEGHYEGQTLAYDPISEFGSYFVLDGSRSEDVWLLADPGDGNPLQFVDHVDFGPSFAGESFGRWPNSDGDPYPMTDFTPDATNSGPRLPQDVVISEVMYNPPGDDVPDDLEFIEIYNKTAAPVDLTDWRLRKGFDYDFAPGTTLDAHEALVIVSFDTNETTKLNAFRTEYGIGPEVAILGNPFDAISDTGEQIQLQRPDTPPPNDPLYVPRPLEDQIEYLDTWYASANGGGQSLTRAAGNPWGNDSASWSPESPTPGSVIPEPSTIILLLTAALGVILYRRR